MNGVAKLGLCLLTWTTLRPKRAFLLDERLLRNFSISRIFSPASLQRMPSDIVGGSETALALRSCVRDWAVLDCCGTGVLPLLTIHPHSPSSWTLYADSDGMVQVGPRLSAVWTCLQHGTPGRSRRRGVPRSPRCPHLCLLPPPAHLCGVRQTYVVVAFWVCHADA